MGRPRKYTDEQFKEAVRTSESIAQVMNKLDLSPTGGNYTHFRVIATKLGVDYSHFTGQSHLRGKRHNWTPNRPLSEVMVKNSDYNKYHLKKRLIKEGILEEHCDICGITDWQDQPLSLHIDHINGDPLDHRLVNLRLLCPNCHSQTDTYGGKNKKKRGRAARIRTENNFFLREAPLPIRTPPQCMDCGIAISKQAKRCKSCASRNRQQHKIDWPPIQKLIDMVQSTNYTQAAQCLGVSDNAVRKHIHRIVGGSPGP